MTETSTGATAAPDPAGIARAFHEAYEQLAPQFGYETREASAKPWEDVPAQNRDLMAATVGRLLADGVIAIPPDCDALAALPSEVPLRLARCPEHPGSVHAQLGSAGEWACLRGLADVAEAGVPKGRAETPAAVTPGQAAYASVSDRTTHGDDIDLITRLRHERDDAFADREHLRADRDAVIQRAAGYLERLAELTRQRATAAVAPELAAYARTILPPPGAVVSAAYLTAGPDGPKIILEICPHCTAATGDDSRMCLCRAQCTYAACRHDDPMTLLVTGAKPQGGDDA